MPKVPVALQLYTVRDETAKDFKGTVRKVAQMGYAGIEMSGDGGLSMTEMKELLAETRLKVAGSHVGLERFEKDLANLLAFYKATGTQFVGVPALPGDLRNPAGYKKAAASLNKIGAEMQKAGLVLYYHNHAFEFEAMDGQRGIDVLLGETDPALVKFEVDVYWVCYGGQDPAAFIRAHSGRFPLIHLKDMKGTGKERTYTEVGEGLLDFQAIFTASEAQGAAWYIVEQDICARPTLESAKLSLDNLKKWDKA
jgi:sugar phosphate isomerase/epimerase